MEYHSTAQLRAELSVILLLTFATGFLLGRILLLTGMDSLVERNAIVFPLTYLAFFGYFHFWRRIVGNRRFEPEPPGYPKEPRWTILDHLWPVFGEATAILILVAIVLYVIVWIFGEAPAIMAEAFLDLGLSASLASAIRNHDQSPWYVGLFQKTAFAFIAFYASSEALLYLSHLSCPTQATLAGVIRSCWMR